MSGEEKSGTGRRERGHSFHVQLYSYDHRGGRGGAYGGVRGRARGKGRGSELCDGGKYIPQLVGGCSVS